MSDSSRSACAIALALELIAGAGSSRAISSRKPPHNYSDPAGYAAMSLVLKQAAAPLSRQILKIHGRTAKQSELWAGLEKCGKVPDEFAEAAADFYWRTSVNATLANKFALNFPYRLSIGRGNSEEFHKEDTVYPRNSKENYSGWVSSDSMYTLALGMDSQKLHAIVYLGSECGALCGGAQYYFLRCVDGVWQLAPEIHSCEMVA